MCYHSKQTKSAQELKQRFKANFFEEDEYTPTIYNGFSFPKTPIIANNNTHNIQLFNWGLIPPWAKDTDIRKNTLNARIETLHEKPSFKSSLKNRCLVLSDGFYEWQWLDEKGKNKQKFQITLPNNEAFAFAGLWNEWVDKETGEILKTYTIITTEATGLMAKIHNSKNRMPFILTKEKEFDWLNGEEYAPHEVELMATPI